jgi:hypothetical protein
MSEKDDSVLKSKDNIEIQKLLLEQKRLEQEKDLKEKELKIQKEEVAKSQWGAPVVAAFIAGIIGLLGTFWNNYQNLQLERQKQEGTLILEAIKTGTGETKQAAANLLFLDKANLIHLTKTQHENLEKEVGTNNPLPSLPLEGERINFQSSTALTPDLERSLQVSLNSFQEYFTKLGYKPTINKVNVFIDPSTAISNVYYDSQRALIVVGQSFAKDIDVVLREFTHHALLDFLGKDKWTSITDPSFRAIESGLADYFPCSFSNDPFFGEGSISFLRKQMPNEERFKKPYIRNLDNKRNFNELSSNTNPVDTGEIWGGAFWNIRQQLGQDLADKLFFSAWSSLTQTNIHGDFAINFVKRLMEIDQKLEGGKHVNEIKAIFEQRGLNF